MCDNTKHVSLTILEEENILLPEDVELIANQHSRYKAVNWVPIRLLCMTECVTMIQTNQIDDHKGASTVV